MVYAHGPECPKGKLNVSSGLTPSQVFHNRRDFERGLLAVILDENRKAGFQQMERVAQTISTVLPPNSSWTLLAHWLNALAADRLPLTSKSLELLRQVGKSLKDLDRQAQQASQADWVMPLEVAFLVVPLNAALGSAQTPGDEDAEQWTTLLGQLQTTKDLASLRLSFAQVADFAAARQWRDVLEITGAQINLLDRLLDGTLAAAPEHDQVLGDAKTLLHVLTLPPLGETSANPTQIDDTQYERVIERADVLASGGEFVLDDAEKTLGGENADFAQVQLATVLEMLPGLLGAYQEQLGAGTINPELEADMQAVSDAAERLRASLTKDTRQAIL